MIELDPGKVSAHYIEPAVSHETGTEVKVEPKQEYHKAPVIEETDIKYKDCIPLKWIQRPQPCFKVWDIEKLIENWEQWIIHEWFEYNLLHNYAYELGWLDFVLTLNAENGRWDHNVKSPVNGNGYRDVWLCQLNLQRHADFFFSDDYQNPYKQLRYCYDVYSDAVNKGRIRTTFYWYNHRHQRNMKWDWSKWIYRL